MDIQVVHQGASRAFPPTVMFCVTDVTQAIDVWSVGCILAKMLSGKPLYLRQDYHHQLTLILDMLGMPTLDEFYAIMTRHSWDASMPSHSGKGGPLPSFSPMPVPWQSIF